MGIRWMEITDTPSPLTPEVLRERILACTLCTARKEAKRPTPFWPRTTPAPIMMIGRNPGYNEDEIGKPFVGRGGELLEGWLRGLGLERDQIWLTNTLKCYTQADRKPKGREVNTCWNAHLRWEIAFCKPELIIPLGAEAFNVTTGLDQLTYRHGILYDKRESMNAYVMGVIHPGSALRSSEYMSMMIEDAKALKPLLPIALEERLLRDGPPEDVIPQ